MPLLQDLGIRYKLFLLGGVMMLALFAVGGAALRGIAGLRAASEKSPVYINAVRNVLQARSALDFIRSQVLWALYNNQTLAEKRHAIAQEVEGQLQEAGLIFQASLGELGTLTRQQKVVDAVQVLQPGIEDYLTQATGLVQHQRAETRETEKAAIDQFQERFMLLSRGLDVLGDMVTTEANRTKEKGELSGEHATKTTLRVMILGTFVALTLGFLITQTITKPMSMVTTTATRLARGEVNLHIDHYTQDETGELAQAFRELVAYIHGLANAADRIGNGDLSVVVAATSEHDVLSHSFCRMVERLRTVIGQMQQSAQVLGVALSQILTSTSQVAASTAETAAAVTQTATTVEEMKQTAHLAHKKVAEVAEEGQRTVEISRVGEVSIEHALTGMNHVREQMEGISQSVMKLGKQSQAIREIVTVVNDLSEQSNLLAINAAIEAAKAGDAGKGFAVVAQEVRTLAVRSRQATAQVTAILSDIQKSVQSAVLVSEQGKKAAETGAMQSVQAGGSIRALAQSITTTANAVSQITASSQQQSVGMDQVALAMESIKQATDQNVSGVRQVEAATRRLQEVGRTLRGLVEQYQLNAGNEEIML
ncbi:MAG: methyl-accepting chemotaxis protein [Candidatus Binatia bacterium]